MVRVETNTQPETEVRDALVAHGYKIVEEEKKPEPKPVVEKPSEPVGEPGEDKVPAETAGERTIAPEGEEPTQETPPAPTQISRPKEKAKGGFQVKVEKLTARVDDLQEQLDNERGDKTRLTNKLAEAQAELDRLKGTEGKPAEPVKDAGPVRPKRPVMPDLAEFDYDQEKYSTAVKQYRADSEKYETEMDAYTEAVAEKKVTEGIAKSEAKAKQARIEEIAQKAQEAFFVLKEKDAKELDPDDWAELADPDNEPKWQDISAVLPQMIFESEIPGHLMMYLYKNPEELERIGKMIDRFGNPDVLRQTAMIGRIEDKVAAELKSKRAAAKGEPRPKAEAAPKAEPVAATPPAKPKPRAETPDAPLAPVGARAGGGAPIDFNAQLKAAADAAATGDQNAVREYRRLRAMQYQEKQAARAR
jgi:hypothetical protein